MNQIKIGNYILKKRKELNLTQEKLADKLGMSNKTISKWECGKSMPDYNIIEPLCDILNITPTELFNGDDKNNNNDKQMLDMLERIQRLENQKSLMIGLINIVMGIALFGLSNFVDRGTNISDFIRGLIEGISVGEMLIGVYIVSKSFSK